MKSILKEINVKQKILFFITFFCIVIKEIIETINYGFINAMDIDAFVLSSVALLIILRFKYITRIYILFVLLYFIFMMFTRHFPEYPEYQSYTNILILLGIKSQIFQLSIHYFLYCYFILILLIYKEPATPSIN